MRSHNEQPFDFAYDKWVASDEVGFGSDNFAPGSERCTFAPYVENPYRRPEWEDPPAVVKLGEEKETADHANQEGRQQSRAVDVADDSGDPGSDKKEGVTGVDDLHGQESDRKRSRESSRGATQGATGEESAAARRTNTSESHHPSTMLCSCCTIS